MLLLDSKLDLKTIETESLRIKTFGSSGSQNTLCDVVQLGLNTNDDDTLEMTALVVPFICHPPTSQPISETRELCDHLLNLELADSALPTDSLEIDVLIGSDSYWNLVTGKIVKRENGLTAIHTRFFRVQLVNKMPQLTSHSTQRTL